MCPDVIVRRFAGTFVLALGFGNTPAEAGHRALASLTDGFDAAQSVYVREWQDWQQFCLRIADDQAAGYNAYRTSVMVLRAHESKRLPGGLIASLSFPWGFAKSDDDMGGYHLAWPRDLVESRGVEPLTYALRTRRSTN